VDHLVLHCEIASALWSAMFSLGLCLEEYWTLSLVGERWEVGLSV
jgi:hypothetical protein